MAGSIGGRSRRVRKLEGLASLGPVLDLTDDEESELAWMLYKFG